MKNHNASSPAGLLAHVFTLPLPAFHTYFHLWNISEPFSFLCFWFHWSLHSRHNHCLCLAARTFIVIEERCKTKKHMPFWSSAELGFKRAYIWDNFELFWVLRCTIGNERRDTVPLSSSPPWIIQCTQLSQPRILTWSSPTTVTPIDFSLTGTSAEFHRVYQTV